MLPSVALPHPRSGQDTDAHPRLLLNAEPLPAAHRV
ncbi:LEPR-XLL domain-containing protein [Alcaligenes sp. SDU_A2]